MYSNKFELEKLYTTALRRWYLLLAGLVLGGLLGLFVAAMRAPLYEAKASIVAAVDWDRAIVPDDITVYQAYDRVRALLLSDETLSAAIQILNHDDPPNPQIIDPTSVRSMLKITQNRTNFELYAYATDPTIAASVANAWAEAGMEALQEAFFHAIRTAELQNALYEASCTLRLRETDSGSKAVWFCKSGVDATDQSDLPKALVDETEASRGILPIFSFSVASEPSPPIRPILWDRSGFIIAGVLAGLIVSFLIAMTLGPGSIGPLKALR